MLKKLQVSPRIFSVIFIVGEAMEPLLRGVGRLSPVQVVQDRVLFPLKFLFFLP
jgi:hypothetical protein